MRFCTAVIVLLAAAAPQASAQHTSHDAEEGFSSLARAPVRVGGPFVSLIHDRLGQPILVINYPWSEHQRVSVEVSSVPADQALDREVRPLFFFDKYFKGEEKLAVYQCQDASAQVATEAKFVKDKIDFQVLGQRNSLGRPSSLVACQTKIEETTTSLDRALFCLLEPWAVDGRILQLDLPQTCFAKPGKIRVWLLRGDTVLWTEDLTWPGFLQ